MLQIKGIRDLAHESLSVMDNNKDNNASQGNRILFIPFIVLPGQNELKKIPFVLDME